MILLKKHRSTTALNLSFLVNRSGNLYMSYKFPKLVNEIHYVRSFTEDLALFVFIPNDSNIDQSIDDFIKLRSQSFTSLIADLRQDIKRVSSFSRCLNGTLH